VNVSLVLALVMTRHVSIERPSLQSGIHWPAGAFGTEAMPMTSGVLLPHTSAYNERDVILLLRRAIVNRGAKKSVHASKGNLHRGITRNRWITAQTKQAT